MSDTVDSFTKRKLIREEIERSGAEGTRLDVGVKCKCPDCGTDHYKRPEPEKKDVSG